MSVFSILAVCLLSICSITGFVMFILRKKFLTFNIEIEFKKLFHTCFAIPTIVETCELFLSLGALILVFCDCGTGGTLNEKAYFWAGGLLGGMLIGAILGGIYWKKVKKPFFIQYFKDEYIKYIQEVKSM